MAKTNEQQDNAATAQRRPQMADIARLAGVSTTTVSRALSHSPLVNAETHARIMKLARSLNYTINIGAQNLRLKQNRTIGVMMPIDRQTHLHLSDPFLLAMLGGLADALSEQGFDMLFSRIDAAQIDDAAMPFDTGRVIGVILVGQWHNHHQLNQLAVRRVPLVVWGAQMSQQLYCTVGCDNVNGGRLATEHLLGQGRRRIAFLGDTGLPEPVQRYRGYCAALEAHGLAPDPQLQIPASFLRASGAQAIEELAVRGVQYDALFAASDLLAMMAIDAMRARGLSVPDDVAVVGYDDIAQSAYFHPRLTTVRQPIAAAGEVLVRSLLAMLDGEPAVSVVLPTELVVRSSSCKPA